MEASSWFSFGNPPDLSVRSSQGVHTTGVVGSNSASDIFVDRTLEKCRVVLCAGMDETRFRNVLES